MAESTHRSQQGGGAGQLRSAGREVKHASKATRSLDDFEQFGALAGPPTRPEASDLEAVSCALCWGAPRHTGGKGISVTGYRVTVRFAGDGDACQPSLSQCEWR